MKKRRQKKMEAHASEDSTLHSHNRLFPLQWEKRWRALTLISATVTILITIGHYLGGLEALHNIWAATISHPMPPAPPDLNLTLATVNTRPLLGYHLTHVGGLPPPCANTEVLAEGRKTRLILQATDSTRIVHIDRIAINVISHSSPLEHDFDYAVDPREQPGQGTAIPKQFLVVLQPNGTARVTYIAQNGQVEETQPDNILPKQFPILVLDLHDGLQESLDFSLFAAEPGIYEVRFKAAVTSGGIQYDPETKSICIVKI